MALHYTQIKGLKKIITTLNNDSLMCSFRDSCFHQRCLKQWSKNKNSKKIQIFYILDKIVELYGSINL